MKKDWLDDSNWFEKVDAQGTQYKQLAFQTFQLIKQYDNPSSTIKLDFLFKDIDIVSYLLSRYYFQHSQLLANKALQKHFADIDRARYILTNGCMWQFWTHLIKLHPSLALEKELAKASFKHGREQNKLFPALMKNRLFIDSLLRKKIYNEEMLELYPRDLKITKALLAGGYRPEGKLASLYNTDVYTDREFIKKCIGESSGRYLYPLLPEDLQNDIEICEIVLAKHPDVSVKNNSIKTIEDFLKHMQGENIMTREVGTVMSNMKKYPAIFNDAHHIQQVFKAFKEHDSSSYIDYMGDPYFTSHIFQDFFKEKALENIHIKEFIETPFGKKMMSEPISSKNYENYEKIYIKIIPDELDSFIRAFDINNKLENTLTEKENKHSINKL